MPLDERIEYIKKRPLMYLTSKKAENIECFLRGALLAIELYEKKNEFENFFENNFCDWTKEWLCKKRKMSFDEEYDNWSKYIRKASKDDEESYELFFEIEEEFEKRYNQKYNMK